MSHTWLMISIYVYLSFGAEQILQFSTLIIVGNLKTNWYLVDTL